MVYAVRRTWERKAIGKATAVFIRGGEVTEDDVNSYFKRRPLTVTERHRPLEDTPTPSEMVLSTPRCQASVLVTAGQTTSPAVLNHAGQTGNTRDTDVEYEVFSQQALSSLVESVRPSPSFYPVLDQATQPTFQTFSYCPGPEEDFVQRVCQYIHAIDAEEAQLNCSREGRNLTVEVKWYFKYDFTGAQKVISSNKIRGCSKYLRLRVRGRNSVVAKWIRFVFLIAKCLKMAALLGQDQKDNALNILYYHVSGQLGPKHPGVYLLSSAARADAVASLGDLLGFALSNLQGSRSTDGGPSWKWEFTTAPGPELWQVWCLKMIAEAASDLGVHERSKPTKPQLGW